MRSSYLAKEKFSEDEAEMLADMLSEARKSASATVKATQAQDGRDDKIKASLIDGSEKAIDSRAEKIVSE